MKRTIAGLALVIATGCTIAGVSLSAPVVAAPAASTAAMSVDTGHSSVLFKIKHNDVSWFYGRFNQFDGSFNLDPENPGASSIDVTVQADSVDTGNKKRDDHLRSQDFFSAKEFPTITFKSDSVRKTGDNTFEATGDLTLHGVTKQVTVPIDLTGTGKNARGNPVAGMHATFTIERSNYGVNYMLGKGLSDEVTLIVSLQGRGG